MSTNGNLTNVLPPITLPSPFQTTNVTYELCKLTKILPVVVCPDINSPAQSLASVMKVPSNSCFPCRLAFCSFCFGSFGDSSGSLRQHKKAKARHSKTTRSPAKKVNMLLSRKHHHLCRDFFFWGGGYEQNTPC